jgi:hypothetical protein
MFIFNQNKKFDQIFELPLEDEWTLESLEIIDIIYLPKK